MDWKNYGLEKISKSHKLIILSLIVAVIALFILGFFGISNEVILEAENCKENYIHYYVTPFISDYFECRIMSPCGTHQDVTIHNTKVRLLKCLCKDTRTNNEKIINYFVALVSDYAHLKDQWPNASQNSDFICKEETLGNLFVYLI